MSPFDPAYKPQMQPTQDAERSRRASERRQRDLAAGKEGASGYLGPLSATTPDERGQKMKRLRREI